jgi:hypothetical protein
LSICTALFLLVKLKNSDVKGSHISNTETGLHKDAIRWYATQLRNYTKVSFVAITGRNLEPKFVSSLEEDGRLFTVLFK